MMARLILLISALNTAVCLTSPVGLFGDRCTWSAAPYGVTDQEIKKSTIELGWSSCVKLRIPAPYVAKTDELEEDAIKSACMELLLARELRVGRGKEHRPTRILSLPLMPKLKTQGYPIARITHYPIVRLSSVPSVLFGLKA
jgi:hypothetical protein